MQTKLDKIKYNWQNANGIRIVVASFGILCGLTGIIAGYFEILQGNIAPNGLIISTIGSNYIMAADFTYFAITIVPSLLLTGILAILVSCLVIVWSTGFVHKKNGVIIFLGLSMTQTIVGGGWVIDLAIITSILATRINKPLNWWTSHLPAKIRFWLSKLLPLSLVVYAIISFSMLALTVLGVNDATVIKPMELLATIMFIPILLMIFGGIAHDIQRKLTIEVESETISK